VNKQDAAALTKMLAMDALYLDEDGHAIPATVWVMRITTGTPAKVFTISGSHGQLLDENTGWVSFNYTLAETFQNAPKTLSGTASMVLKKAGTDWSILKKYSGESSGLPCNAIPLGARISMVMIRIFRICDLISSEFTNVQFPILIRSDGN